jgi:enoyl-CoA hydratase/carnithine racemase
MTTAPFDTIEVTVDGARGALTLDRGDKLNPLSSHTLHEIELAARWLDTHDDLKVVVVSGRGRAFSAGADVSAFGAGAPADGRSPRDDADSGWRMARAMDELRAVTIARIQGWCVGGGLVLAAVCDLRVAASGARFSIPEVELGIPLAWGGIPRLVREVGPAVTKELVMTCRAFSAEEAQRLGLVNVVAPKTSWLEDAIELAQVVARRPPLAIKLAKQAVLAAEEMPLSAGLQHERRLYELTMATEDRVEGMTAFLEKRRPEFEGR